MQCKFSLLFLCLKDTPVGLAKEIDKPTRIKPPCRKAPPYACLPVGRGGGFKRNGYVVSF